MIVLIRFNEKWDGNVFSVEQEMDYSEDISEAQAFVEIISPFWTRDVLSSGSVWSSNEDSSSTFSKSPFVRVLLFIWCTSGTPISSYSKSDLSGTRHLVYILCDIALIIAMVIRTPAQCHANMSVAQVRFSWLDSQWVDPCMGLYRMNPTWINQVPWKEIHGKNSLTDNNIIITIFKEKFSISKRGYFLYWLFQEFIIYRELAAWNWLISVCKVIE